MRNQSLGVRGLWVAVLWLAGALCAGAQGAYEHPTWRIPKLAVPPTVDGVINDAEYAGVPAITGMVTWGGPGGADRTLVPEVQQVVWYLGHDDHFLYIAMRSPQAPGTWPRARVKDRDNGNVLWDDHVEIQIATRGRRSIASPGKGFYKITGGAKAFKDEWLYNGTPGTELDWSIGGDYQSTVTAAHWDLEIKIAVEALREKNFDAKSWVIQLLRADAPGGVYFAGWTGEYWMNWEKFGEVIFDPTAPVFRFTKVGEASKGDPHLHFDVLGVTDERQQVDVTVTYTDGAGKELYKKLQTVTVGKGERQSLDFTANGLPLTEKGNLLHVLATRTRAPQDGAAVTDTLYEVQLPVLRFDEKYKKETLDPWLAERPRSGDFEWSFFYWPSYGVAENKIDVDFFGMKDEIFHAKRFEVSIAPAGKNKKALVTGKAELLDHAGTLNLATGKLPAGDYVATLKMIGPDGKTVVGTKTRAFVRQTYAWENNTLGRSDVLLPPFPALRVAGDILQPCLREYTVGQDGLFSKILAEGGLGKENILRAPIRLEGLANGNEVLLRDAKREVGLGTPTRVKVGASGTLGNARITCVNEMEYDGWYDVKMTVAPATPGATLDRLTLVLPLWKGADTMYIQRGHDGFAGANRIGEIPAGEGIVWDSGTLLPEPGWGTFVPIAYAGNGDKGLWWFAEENRDWTMSATLPAVQYVRTADGGVDVRINIFAAPTTLDRPREIHFALLADPVKKMANERKIGWGWQGQYNHGWYAHSTFGWRFWGHSQDGYYMTDEDREGLRQLLLGMKQPRAGDGSASHFANNLGPAARAGAPVTIYGSTSNMTWDLPEFDTYQGEWIRYTSVPPDGPAPKAMGWNVQGTSEYNTIRTQGEQGINFVKSQQDCYVWYHKKLLESCPVNGTWWDNGSSTVITDYDPVRKAFYQKWNVFVRRDLCKRLNTIGYEVGRVPWWINNMHVDWSFNQVSWHIENDFYVDDPTNTTLDQMTVANFRAQCRIKRGIIHRLAARYGGGSGLSTPEETRKRIRMFFGLCLLHDIGAYNWDGYSPNHAYLPGVLDRHVGYFDEEDTCKFIGYWNAADFVRVDTPQVYASVYQGNGRAVLVFINENKQDVMVNFAPLYKLLNREPQKVADAETGFPFVQYWNEQLRKRQWGEYEPGTFKLEGHGLRMLVVE